MSLTRIEERLLAIIDALQHLTAEMMLANMDDHANSVVTITDELHWLYREITRNE